MEEADKFFSVVIPSAGASVRMEGKNKLLFQINGKPVIIHTVSVFINNALIKEIILVVPRGQEEFYSDLINRFFPHRGEEENKREENQELNNNLSRHDGGAKIRVITGGRHRQESVFNGVKTAGYPHILVHDGARPFLSQALLNRMLKKYNPDEGLIPVIPLSDTIKRVDKQGFVTETPVREEFRRVQTPQIFPKPILIEAHKKALKDNFIGTDDASLVERLGIRVKTLLGEESNTKITTPGDLPPGLTAGGVIMGL